MDLLERRSSSCIGNQVLFLFTRIEFEPLVCMFGLRLVPTLPIVSITDTLGRTGSNKVKVALKTLTKRESEFSC